MKKFIKSLLVLICVFIPFLMLAPVKADSGWDSDYDSGGSWSGGGSWDSGSWDSGGSWDSDYSGGGSYGDGDLGAFGIVMFFFIIFIIIAVSSKSSVKPSAGNYNQNIYDQPMYNDISEDEIQKYLPNEGLGSLKHMAFENFIAIQYAWSEFKYKKLRELCTDELYNSYKAQLETLKLKNGKNVMNDFEQHFIKIIGINEEAGNIAVKVYLKVSFFDYVVNSKTGEVTRGTNERKITNNYVMTFVKSKDAIESKCPNCGAPIKGNTSSKCEYCDSTIVTKAKNFVLSKKTNVNK